MFSLNVFLALSQLAALAVGAADVTTVTTSPPGFMTTIKGSSSKLSTLPSTRATLTTIASTATTLKTTTSPTPTCPTTFNLFIFRGSQGSLYLNVNSTGSFNSNLDSTRTSYAIRNNRLVTLSNPASGGLASVPKGTDQKGAYLVSTLDTTKYEPVGASLVGSDCQILFDKRVSPQYTLDTLYSPPVGGLFVGPTYLAPKNNPPGGISGFTAYAVAVGKGP